MMLAVEGLLFSVERNTKGNDHGLYDGKALDGYSMSLSLQAFATVSEQERFLSIACVLSE